jgi:inositol phosphorylceramide mannosyltransferase catalytic subunit
VAIPKIIHQIWIGDQSLRPQRWIDSWIQKHPDWRHQLWTESNLPILRCQEQFDSMPSLAGKADILRYEILHAQGGIYLDADSECVSPLTEDLLLNRGFAVLENEYFRPGVIANGVIGCEPGCALMDKLVEAVSALGDLSATAATEVWKVTGPLLFTRTLGQQRMTFYRLYPSFWFYPTHYTGLQYSGYVDRQYAKQYWGSSKAGVYESAAIAKVEGT